MTKAEKARDARQAAMVRHHRAARLRAGRTLPTEADLLTKLDELGGPEAVSLATGMLRDLEGK